MFNSIFRRPGVIIVNMRYCHGLLECVVFAVSLEPRMSTFTTAVSMPDSCTVQPVSNMLFLWTQELNKLLRVLEKKRWK